MKKTYYLNLFTLIFISMVSISIVSCSNDDEATNPLVGTWRNIGNDYNELPFEGEGVNWVFNADGTMLEHDIDENGNIIPNRTEYFKYKTENGHLYTLELEVHDDGSMDDWKDEGAFSISGDILELTREGHIRRRLKKVK